MKQHILNVLNRKSGIKAVDLALDVMSIVNPVRFCTEEYHSAIEELLREQEIIELEYVDSDVPYRVKSIYFRKGTEFLPRRENNEQMDRQSQRNSEISCIKTKRE